MANVTEVKKVINKSNSTAVVFRKYVVLPGQVVIIEDKDWADMWREYNYCIEGGEKVRLLECHHRRDTVNEDKSKMLKYGIEQYLSHTGETPIEATVDGITYTGYIDIKKNIPMMFFKEKPITPVPVESISMSVAKTTISVNEETTATVTFTPATATNKDVTWSSSDDSKVTVVETETGATIKGIATGSARITAVSVDGNKKSYKDITVS